MRAGAPRDQGGSYLSGAADKHHLARPMRLVGKPCFSWDVLLHLQTLSARRQNLSNPGQHLPVPCHVFLEQRFWIARGHKRPRAIYQPQHARGQLVQMAVGSTSWCQGN